MEKIVDKIIHGKNLRFVLDIFYDESNKCEIAGFLFEDIKQSFVKKWYFNSEESAYLFFKNNYNIQVNEWLPPKIHSFDLKIDYTLPSSGTLEPQLLCNDIIEPRMSMKKYEDPSINLDYEITVKMSKEDLIKLGKQLLLFEISDKYDQDYHLHLGSSDRICITFIKKCDN